MDGLTLPIRYHLAIDKKPKTGNIVNHIDNRGRRITNFPGMSDNGICHVRPHGRDSKDTYPQPDGREYPKQSFWLNNSYILSVVKDE